MLFYQSKLMYEYRFNKITPMGGKSLAWMHEKLLFLRTSWFIGKRLNSFATTMYLQDEVINS